MRKILSFLFSSFIISTPAANSQSLPLQVKGVKVGKIVETVDNEIKVNPAMTYLSLEIMEMKGVTIAEVLNGKETFIVTNSQGKIVPVTDKLLHKVKGELGESQVAYTVKIPFRKKSETDKRSVYFKWESPDKRKVLEIRTSQ